MSKECSGKPMKLLMPLRDSRLLTELIETAGCSFIYKDAHTMSKVYNISSLAW